MSFSFDKVTTGMYNFVSVIFSVAPDVATIAVVLPSASVVVKSAKPERPDQVKISSILQLISGIFKVLHKLLKCFSGITTSAFVNESLSSGVFVSY